MSVQSAALLASLNDEERKILFQFKKYVFENLKLPKSDSYWSMASSWWRGDSSKEQTNNSNNSNNSSGTSYWSSWWSGSSNTNTTTTTTSTSTTTSNNNNANNTKSSSWYSWWYGNDSSKQQDQQKEQEQQVTSSVVTAPPAFLTKHELTDEEVKKYMFLKNDDEFLLRFLKNKNFDLNKSVEMFRTYLRYRIDFKLDELKPEHLLQLRYPKQPDRFLIDTDIIVLIGPDKNGVPGIFLMPSKIEPGIYDYDDLVKAFGFSLELLVKKGMVNMNLIIYYKDWTLSNVDREVDSRLLAIGNGFYPYLMNKAYLVDAPWFFRGVWSVISYFIDEKVSTRINMIPLADITQYYDLSSLPEELGGSFKGVTIREFITNTDGAIKKITSK